MWLRHRQAGAVDVSVSGPILFLDMSPRRENIPRLLFAHKRMWGSVRIDT